MERRYHMATTTTRALMLVLSILACSFASANMYWVSPIGAAAWAQCSGESPIQGTVACTLTIANANVMPGDTVHLDAGTYTTGIAPARSGTQSERITYRGVPGTIITGTDTGIDVEGKAYITIDNVTVTNTNTFADLRSANHIWIFNSILVNSSDSGGWPLGIRMYTDSESNWLANSTIGNSGYMSADDDIGGVMNMGDWSDPDDTTSYNLIENNDFFRGGHHIIEIASHHNIIRNNTFHNEDVMPCNRPSMNNLCGNRNIILADDSLDAYWNIIEDNRFAFAGASIDDSTGNTGASIRSTHNIVRNNLFFLNGGPGMVLYVDSTLTYDARDNHIYSNVYYKNGISPLSASDYRYTFGLNFDNVAGNGAPLPIKNVTVKNNILFGNTGGDIFFYYTDPTQQTVLGNYYGSTRGSDSRGFFDPVVPTNNIKNPADPLFVDIGPTPIPAKMGEFDFRLLNTSPAIDAGVFLTTTASSGIGTVMTVTDAGYFTDGLGIVSGDIIQLEGSSDTARITAIDYGANRITIDAPLTWDAGQGVSLQYSGNRPDIGAYEYSGQQLVCIHRADNNPCDGCISSVELTAYMTQWQSSGSLANILQVIQLWKRC
jgi:hypothetical protein